MSNKRIAILNLQPETVAMLLNAGVGELNENGSISVVGSIGERIENLIREMLGDDE